MVIPSKLHRAVGKETGQISYIKRFNNYVKTKSIAFGTKSGETPRYAERHPLGRRKTQTKALAAHNARQDTLSFSKSVTNHIDAIWNFISYYNASLDV